MIKVKDLLKELNALVKADNRVLELPIIYSVDPEGNAYHKVDYSAGLGKVSDIKEYYLEGFETSIKIGDGEGANCVIIN